MKGKIKSLSYYLDEIDVKHYHYMKQKNFSEMHYKKQLNVLNSDLELNDIFKADMEYDFAGAISSEDKEKLKYLLNKISIDRQAIVHALETVGSKIDNELYMSNAENGFKNNFFLLPTLLGVVATSALVIGGIFVIVSLVRSL